MLYGCGATAAPEAFNASISAGEYPASARISSVCMTEIRRWRAQAGRRSRQPGRRSRVVNAPPNHDGHASDDEPCIPHHWIIAVIFHRQIRRDGYALAGAIPLHPVFDGVCPADGCRHGESPLSWISSANAHF